MLAIIAGRRISPRACAAVAPHLRASSWYASPATERILHLRRLVHTRHLVSQRQVPPQQPRTPDQQSAEDEGPVPPTNPTILNIARVLGGIGGVYLAFKFVNWVNDKFIDPAGAPMRQGKRPAAPIKEVSPYPHIPIEPMDPASHTLSEIFSSVLEPLVSFDQLADDFCDRKHEASLKNDALQLKRKKQSVPAKEAKEIEVEWTKIQAEERNRFQPRLEFLSQLYYVRSGELMQRSQMLAEQRFDLGSKVQQASGLSSSEQVEARELNLAARKAQDEEMAAFQALSMKNQHLLQIVNKYQLRGADGPSGSLKRQMQNQQLQQMRDAQKQQQQQQQGK